jgi:predicted MFS family arabinose efflux permease
MTHGNDRSTRSKPMTTEMAIFFVLISFVALGNGLSDGVYANYFKEVYRVDSVRRGFIEFPRELPGLLCAAVIALLSSLGDLRSGLIAQILSVVGLAALGLFTPPFAVMLVFLFINSMGMHLFMPLQDAIGMSLAEPGQIGRRVGQYASLRSAVGFGAAILIYVGFRTGFFDFQSPRKLVFLVGTAAFAVAVFLFIPIIRRVQPGRAPKKKFRILLRSHYKYFYLLTTLHGVQKQVAYVYGTWVIVDLLAKGADTIALLGIASSFVSIFFMNMLGRMMDRFGIKKMMYVDALSFIIIYILYGFLVYGISSRLVSGSGWPVFTVYVMFVLDRLSMQIGMVKSLYLRSIALSDEEVTATLSTGISLDHVVSILAALAGGLVWKAWGAQWVFFLAAVFSLGNLYVAVRVDPAKERAHALEHRAAAGTAAGVPGVLPVEV